jgi:uncharacterized membrane protein YukC
LISNAREWVLDANEKQKGQPKYNDPVISSGQIKEKVKEINEKVKKIMSKPLPPPPKKEEKKEEKKDEKMEPESKEAAAGDQPEKMETE